MFRSREGDHTGRFTLPDGRQAFGTVSLEPDRPPTASLHPDDRTPIGPEGRGFPQDSGVEELVGNLHSNEEVILGDVHLSEWFPDQIHASSRWGLIGLDLTRIKDRRWKSLALRVTGLEVILGNAISATHWPRTADADPLRYSADLNRDSEFVSAIEGVTIAAHYEPIFSPADPYRFSLRNYATAHLTADNPLTVDEWARGWIDPLVGLLTLATGERELINTAFVSAPDPDSSDESPASSEISGQLFGGAIHQRDQPAERRTRSDGSPLVPLFTLNASPPLATIIRDWRTGVANETAATLYRLAIDPSLPPHVRYLLCAQALEALDSSARAAEEDIEDRTHAELRAAARATIERMGDDALDADVKRFIRQNLRREPPRALGSRLSRLITDVPDSAAHATKWTRMTEPLAEELDSLGRSDHALHERLASARNVLSHGLTLPASTLIPAIRVLETLLRGQLLKQLGFDAATLAIAYERMAREG